ncbi:MAG: glycosyltransferase, partial [Boseongicola sp.]
MELALIPILILILVAQFMPSWSRHAPIRSAIMATGYSLIAGIYIWWRLTETVLPARGFSFSTTFVWIVFLAELWLWIETFLLAAILLRRSNRSPEADAHEARLRTLAADEYPGVDVFIATYNEPLDVLEKTIAGALALDWPKDRLFVHVLDDGRRDWLRDYCQARSVNYLTRNDNFHAKAGNINAAVKRTSAPFILILDADFVPQNKMLMRSIGFFRDMKIGIVQMPHHFFNSTPLQTNMDMRSSLPDQQRFFFDVIQPGRDAVDCAFCCGSNGVIRRSALAEVGGEIPTGSVTGDLLLTLVLLRKGYIT